MYRSRVVNTLINLSQNGKRLEFKKQIEKHQVLVRLPFFSATESVQLIQTFHKMNQIESKSIPLFEKVFLTKHKEMNSIDLCSMSYVFSQISNNHSVWEIIENQIIENSEQILIQQEKSQNIGLLLHSFVKKQKGSQQLFKHFEKILHQISVNLDDKNLTLTIHSISKTKYQYLFSPSFIQNLFDQIKIVFHSLSIKNQIIITNAVCVLQKKQQDPELISMLLKNIQAKLAFDKSFKAQDICKLMLCLHQLFEYDVKIIVQKINEQFLKQINEFSLRDLSESSLILYNQNNKDPIMWVAIQKRLLDYKILDNLNDICVLGYTINKSAQMEPECKNKLLKAFSQLIQQEQSLKNYQQKLSYQNFFFFQDKNLWSKKIEDFYIHKIQQTQNEEKRIQNFINVVYITINLNASPEFIENLFKQLIQILKIDQFYQKFSGTKVIGILQSITLLYQTFGSQKEQFRNQIYSLLTVNHQFFFQFQTQHFLDMILKNERYLGTFLIVCIHTRNIQTEDQAYKRIQAYINNGQRIQERTLFFSLIQYHFAQKNMFLNTQKKQEFQQEAQTIFKNKNLDFLEIQMFLFNQNQENIGGNCVKQIQLLTQFFEQS